MSADAARQSALERARFLEEACDFAGAAEAALAGADAATSARLAALAKADAVFDRAEEQLAIAGPEALVRVGEDLAARGHTFYAGRLLERGGSFLDAGNAFARAGAAARAALAFEKGGRPADGAKAIDRALKDDPQDDTLRRALAELLLRHGKTEGAIKALQQMSDGPERDRSLPLLARSLRALGLIEAAAQVEEEIATLASLPPPSAKPESVAPASAAPAATGAGSVLFGRYEVVREVRKTPHAHLFEAVDRLAGVRVAVKILATSSRGAGRDAFVRFEREARALEQLRHPTIVSLHDFLPDAPAMVLEWMHGGSLAELMKRDVFAPARAVEVACAILTALGQAHRLGVLHRDVKPSNVLFDDVGAPKLADFGAAHIGDLSTTVTAGAIGTFSYMSPEQRLGLPATVQSDLYGVGALLYEMLTGEGARPLRDEGGFVEKAPSAYHMDLGPEHDALVAPFLHVQPERRPPDAFEARKLLERRAWSTRSVPREGPASTRSSARPLPTGEARLVPPSTFGDGRDAVRLRFDTVAERTVIVVDLDGASLERFRPWAKVMHPSLSALLRASVSDAQLWFEAPRGRCLADIGGSLSPTIVGELRDALTDLHHAGGAHGCLDREHVYLSDGNVFIAPPRDWQRPASRVDDFRALEALAV